MKKMAREMNLREKNMQEVIFDLLKERDELNEIISKQDKLIDSQDKLISSLERENNSLSELILFKEMSERRNSSVDYDFDFNIREMCYLHSLFMREIK